MLYDDLKYGTSFNTEYVSDIGGFIYQHFFYSPFGEALVSQHANSGRYDTEFRFNGKEQDPELQGVSKTSNYYQTTHTLQSRIPLKRKQGYEQTGLYYYGARYYNPKYSIWMSVDPLANEFPSWTPYHYVHNNPVNLVDPDGRSAVDPNDCCGPIGDLISKGKSILIQKTSEYAQNVVSSVATSMSNYVKENFEFDMFFQAELTVEGQAGGSAHVEGLGGRANYEGQELVSFKLGTDDTKIDYYSKNGEVVNTSGAGVDLFVGGSVDNKSIVKNVEVIQSTNEKAVSVGVPVFGSIYGSVKKDNLTQQVNSIEGGYSNRVDTGLFLNMSLKVNFGYRIQKKH